MPLAGFEPVILAGDRLQTLALDRSATGIGYAVFTKTGNDRRILVKILYVKFLCKSVIRILSRYARTGEDGENNVRVFAIFSSERFQIESRRNECKAGRKKKVFKQICRLNESMLRQLQLMLVVLFKFDRCTEVLWCPSGALSALIRNDCASVESCRGKPVYVHLPF